MYRITALTFPLHLSELNTFDLSFIVVLPYFLLICASASYTVQETDILNLSFSQSDNLLWSLRLISGALNKSGGICNMVATKHSGRSIFHCVSILLTQIDVRVISMLFHGVIVLLEREDYY